MIKIYTFITSCILSISLQSLAAVNVKDLSLSSESGRGIMTIKYSGNLVDYPELKINQNSIEVLIPNAKVSKSINKKLSFVTKNKYTRISAKQLKSNTARVKTIIPYTVKNVKEKISLVLRDKKIILSFPKLPAESIYVSKREKAESNKKKIVKKNKVKRVEKDLLNEDYLNSLINQEKGNSDGVKLAKNSKDEVKLTQSSVTKKSNSKPQGVVTGGKNTFSLVEYGGKFIAFLGFVLLLFYGIVTLMKKGVIKKGRLGFLNNTDQVSVLSQTYIAPKKSLMLIKAHNQVFLVSNTDSGIHPISEIKDVSGLLKDGEKIIAGDNFDDSLGSANLDSSTSKKVKIKEDITQSNKQSSLSSLMGVKDRVKFSDQIKKKVKGLKPLQ